MRRHRSPSVAINRREVRDLVKESRRNRSAPRVIRTPDLLIRSGKVRCPNCPRVFMTYRSSGCSACSFACNEPVESVCGGGVAHPDPRPIGVYRDLDGGVPELLLYVLDGVAVRAVEKV